MANRFPLIVNPSTNQIAELPNADNLDLTGSGIVGSPSITDSLLIGAREKATVSATASMSSLPSGTTSLSEIPLGTTVRSH